MGQTMVRNLQQAGHRVRAWDTSPEARSQAAAHGAAIASSAKDAFGGDATISMLPNDDAMLGVFIKEDVLPARGSSTIHINMATASVECTKALASAHAQRKIQYVSAPVFGRPEMAARRELNILAAGAPDAIARVQPLFDALGKKTWDIGTDPSNANVAKIAGNLMVACIIESMGEAAALARAYRIPPADLLNVVVGSLFDVPIYRIYAGLIATETFEPAGFDLRLGLKDTKLALAAAEQVNLPLPFASVLRDNYLDALAHGDEHKDWSAITRVAARRGAIDDAKPKNKPE
jgi:3-hydroxyisobutyrate dehydrogenase-like beta-hydroxyacid dehydrogenase